MHDESTSMHVPDYSCCFPSLMAPQKVREYYMRSLREDNQNKLRFIIGIFKKEFEKVLSKLKETPEKAIDREDLTGKQSTEAE